MIYKVEILLHFDNELDVLRLRYDVNSETITSDIFFRTILSDLNPEELINLSKISICQECSNEAEILPFINACQGKIFVNDPSDPFKSTILDIRNNILSTTTTS